MQKVAIAGIGFMGWIHWLAYQQIPNVKVVAIATPEPDRQAGDWTSIQGNFGPPGEKVCLDGIAVYGSLDQMLADPAIEIDLVDICLPPALHADAIVAATSSGNHVLCEKPLALKLDQCDRAVDSASSNQVRLFVGQVLPFFTEFQFAFDKIKSGEFGKLIGGSFRRVISDPQWLPKFYDPDVIGGPLFDLHVHDAHFIRLLFGMPLGVFSAGRHRNGVVDYCHSLFKFDDPEIVVHSTTGVINQQGRPFTHGFQDEF
ncbi:MAG: Gfo/Idh/MocA family oxidoreductase, partial [Planctomycetota bacterium]